MQCQRSLLNKEFFPTLPNRTQFTPLHYGFPRLLCLVRRRTMSHIALRHNSVGWTFYMLPSTAPRCNVCHCHCPATALSLPLPLSLPCHWHCPATALSATSFMILPQHYLITIAMFRYPCLCIINPQIYMVGGAATRELLNIVEVRQCDEYYCTITLDKLTVNF